jgi:uncharacterized damage-inducible protein DinB
MHPRVAEVLEYLDARRDELRTAVDLVPPDLRDKQPGPNRWSVAQVLDHLSMIDRRVGIGMKKWIADARIRGIGPETETASVLGSVPTALIIDRSRRVNAPEEIRPKTSVDAQTAWEALEAARENLRTAFLNGDGAALSEVIQPHPILGPINVYQWILFVGSHEARHTAQVREIAAELSRGGEGG